MSWIDQFLTAIGFVQSGGTPLIQRPTINFLGAGVTAVDDPTTKVTTVTIAAAVAGSQVNAKVAATSNITLSGTQTIDGISAGVGDVALAVGQTAPAENGLWIVALGVWTRTADSLVSGLPVFVQQGVQNQAALYQLVTGGPISPGTTPLQFARPTEITTAALGVKADGSDQLTAFTAAVATAAAAKVKLIIPSGTIVLSDRVLLPDGLYMAGVGPASVLSFTNASHVGLWADGKTVRLEKFKTAGTSQQAIALTGADNCILDQLEVTGGVGDASHASGIWAKGCAGLEIWNCYAYDNGNPASYNGGSSGAEILFEASAVFASGTAGAGTRTIDGTRTKVAQRFVLAGGTSYISQWWAVLATASSFSCTVRIETDAAGSPSGTLAAAGLTSSHTFTAALDVEGSDFATKSPLGAGTYWIVFTRTAGSATFDGAHSGTASQVKSYDGSWSLESGVGADIDNLHVTIGAPNSGRIIAAKLRNASGKADFGMLLFDCQGVGVYDCDIDEGNTLGAGGDTDSSGYGIAMYDADMHLRQNVIAAGRITNCAGSGIYYQGIGTFTADFSPTPKLVVSAMNISNVAQQMSDSLLLLGGVAINASGAAISGCVIDGVGSQGAGITWQGRRTAISGCAIKNVPGRGGLYARVGTSEQDCSGSTIGTTTVSEALYGLHSAGASINSLVTRGLTVHGKAGTIGINLSGAINCDIEATIDSCGQQGIIIANTYADSANNQVRATVLNCGSDSHATYPAILCEGAGDFVFGSRVYGSDQEYGVQLTGARTKIIACDIRGATAAYTVPSDCFVALTDIDGSGAYANAFRNINADDLALYDKTGTQLWGHLSYTDKALELDSGVAGGTLSIKATASGQFVNLVSYGALGLQSTNGAINFDSPTSQQSIFRGTGAANGVIVSHPVAGDCYFDTGASTTSIQLRFKGAEKFYGDAASTLVYSAAGFVSLRADTTKFLNAAGAVLGTSDLSGSNWRLAGSAVAGLQLEGIAGGTGAVLVKSTTLAFYGGTPRAKPAITGALSSVIDANAKAVLTSIVAALAAAAGVNLATDSTT